MTMPISVEWGDEQKTILYYHMLDEWTLEEALFNLENETHDMIVSVPYVPDSIMDMQNAGKMPSGFLLYWRRTYNWMQAHRIESAFIAIVQASPILKGIGDTLRTLRVPIMRYVVFVDSVDEAYQKIAEHRAQTPRIHFDD